MAHSIEGRVPFLDLEMINVAQSIPTELMIRADENGSRVNKWILRKAFEDMLPREIVWRSKEQFDEGTGTVDVVETLTDLQVSPHEGESEPSDHGTPWLRSAEERTYYNLFTETCPNYQHVVGTVGRWAAGRAGAGRGRNHGDTQEAER